ncbi:MAG: ArsI/CadI family heavy metal resistance metalloenzyme [Thiohalomonadales bacterium]
MKRLHIHVTVNKLSENIKFYSTLFNALPAVEHKDYAKWDLIEPAVNFAISSSDHVSGINHLGIQVDSEDELGELAQRLDNAEITFSKQEDITCCYANSNKHWVLDPQGISWESFHTLAELPTYGDNENLSSGENLSACCIPLNISQSNGNEKAACCVK